MTSVGEALFEPTPLELSPRTEAILERRLHAPAYQRRGWFVRRALLAADVVGLAVAFLVAEACFGLGRNGTLGPGWELLVFAGAVPVWIVAAKLYGLYDRDEEHAEHSTTDEITGVFNTMTVGAWTLFAFVRVAGIASLDLTKLLVFWLVAVAAIPLARAVARGACRRTVFYIQNTIIFGSGTVAQRIAAKCVNHPEYGINVVGFVDSAPSPRAPGAESVAYLAGPERLEELVKLLDVERVIVAFPSLEHEATLEAVRALGAAEIQVDIVPRFYEVVSAGGSFHGLEGVPMIALPPPHLSRSSLVVKRAFDLVVASLLLLVLLPLLPFVAWRIKRESPGPVFFRQERMGAGEQVFRILKFRTMVVDADSRKAEVAHLNEYASGRNGGGPMFKVESDPRVTRVGRLLRSHFVDELPQLLNVVRGEMSLVGPRPLVLDEDGHVADWRRRRLMLKPGMTGSWQVLGRNDIGFDEMLRLDYLYVNTWSLWKDCTLILRTVPLVFRGERRRL